MYKKQLLYGLFRGYGRAGVSIVLTVVSLGSRVALAYALSAIPAVGMVGIWWSVPIGWALADIVGIGIYLRERKQAAEPPVGIKKTAGICKRDNLCEEKTADIVACAMALSLIHI